MLTGAIKSQVDQIWNAFWSGGIANPIEVIEQITYLLFIRDTNKALLLKHIKDNGSTGARMDEFRQVLPALGRTHIQVLLRELKSDGLVYTVGQTRAAKWYATPGITT